MNIFSRWVVTDGKNRGLVESFASNLGDRDAGPVSKGRGDDHVRLRYFPKHELSERSEWVARASEDDVWIVGTADLDAFDSFGGRLVGVITPSASLTDHLCKELSLLLDEEGTGCDQVSFPLRPLLAGNEEVGVQPISVRLLSDSVRILVQSGDGSTLRQVVSQLPGDPIGITMRSNASTVTVTTDGTVIFTDASSAEDVIDSIQQISRATIQRMMTR